MNNQPYVYDIDKIVWHPRQKYTCSQYRQALGSVLNSLNFKDSQMRFNLIGSYRMNLKPMVLYAIENNIDEIEYIKSLYDILNDSDICFNWERE